MIFAELPQLVGILSQTNSHVIALLTPNDTRLIPSYCCFITILVNQSCLEDRNSLHVVAGLAPTFQTTTSKGNKISKSLHKVAIILLVPKSPTTVFLNCTIIEAQTGKPGSIRVPEFQESHPCSHRFSSRIKGNHVILASWFQRWDYSDVILQWFIYKS